MQKIEKLKYHQIDFTKYDTCINNAVNSRMEAFSWYLDIVCNKNWEVLVLNNYQAVMPLPFFRIKKKFFKKMVTQPLFCQQLGIFYTKINDKDFKLFLDFFNKEPILSYHFNAKNNFVTSYFSDFILIKNNYIINLNVAYQNIYKNYNKSLKQKIKSATKAALQIKKNIDFKDFKKLKKENSFHKIKSKHFTKMEELTNTLQQKNKGYFLGAFKDNTLVSVAFFTISKTEIVYLFSATSALGKKNGAAAFLLDYLIKNNCNQLKKLDFEGSNIEGIAMFFKSFGAVNEPYFAIQNT